MTKPITVTRRTVTAAWRERKPFDGSNIKGRWVGPGEGVEFGHLPDEYVKELRTAISRGQVFIVWSYSTPIAWFEATTGSVNKPGVKYSVTTTKQQGLLY